MRKVKMWRYYCDFCKKGGCSSGHMQRHEKHCTGNPARGCRMCAAAGLEQAPIETLKAAAMDGVDDLRKAANGCPACMLAGIRQVFNRADYANLEAPWVDYKAESEAFWKRVNESEYGHARNREMAGIY